MTSFLPSYKTFRKTVGTATGAVGTFFGKGIGYVAPAYVAPVVRSSVRTLAPYISSKLPAVATRISAEYAGNIAFNTTLNWAPRILGGLGGVAGTAAGIAAVELGRYGYQKSCQAYSRYKHDAEYRSADQEYPRQTPVFAKENANNIQHDSWVDVDSDLIGDWMTVDMKASKPKHKCV